MNKLIIVLLIITIFPLSALAHEGEHEADFDSFRQQAGVLPGEVFYFLDQAGGWFGINIFTLSTTKKQQKRLAVAEERLAEFVVLSEIKPDATGALEKAVVGYERELLRSEEMAEAIIFLDGNKLYLAEGIEEQTRQDEVLLSQLLFETESGAVTDSFRRALAVARAGNRKAFNFMVEKYQFTDADIEKYRQIIGEHLELVEQNNVTKDADVKRIIEEARDHEVAGLNARAYEILDEAKDIEYNH